MHRWTRHRDRCGRAMALTKRYRKMLYASVERPPLAGSETEEFAGRKKRSRFTGVRLVPCAGGMAVVGETTWAALKGRGALAMAWEDPPKGAFDPKRTSKRLDDASEQKGIATRRDEAPIGTRPVVRTIFGSYYCPFYAHAPVETMNLRRRCAGRSLQDLGSDPGAEPFAGRSGKVSLGWRRKRWR